MGLNGWIDSHSDTWEIRGGVEDGNELEDFLTWWM